MCLYPVPYLFREPLPRIKTSGDNHHPINMYDSNVVKCSMQYKVSSK